MPAFDVLDALVRGGNGVLRTADAVAAGIARPVLGNYVRERGLERVGHGLYLAPDAWKDGMYLLHLRCPQAVFSHDTALFLHDLTDREPLAYTVTVKSGYNPHRLKGDGVKVYRIKAELHGLGLSQTNTPFGNPVAVYDLGAHRLRCGTQPERHGCPGPPGYTEAVRRPERQGSTPPDALCRSVPCREYPETVFGGPVMIKTSRQLKT